MLRVIVATPTNRCAKAQSVYQNWMSRIRYAGSTAMAAGSGALGGSIC